jgi:hypothetical protein
MKTLQQFESYLDVEFAKFVSAVLQIEDDAELKRIHDDVFPRLERAAMDEGVEVCKRQSWLLVSALYDLYLHNRVTELNLDPDYFTGDRPVEQEALAYLAERRLGGPARHSELTVN